MQKTLILSLALTGTGALSAATLPAPTYNHDIAPILYQNCAGCHQEVARGGFVTGAVVPPALSNLVMECVSTRPAFSLIRLTR